METLLFQFAIPERLSQDVLEKIIPVAGGATVLPALGYWHNGTFVESEPVAFVVVGIEAKKESWLIQAVLNTLREAGESAAWYVRNNVPRLVRFEERSS
jgi:hypothetical protein